MKKRVLLFAVCAAAVLAVLLLVLRPWGARPFQALESGDIASARVELTPPGAAFDLNAEEIDALAEILKAVVIYRRDDSYGVYEGQSVLYTVVKSDGGTVKIMAYNPFVVIDGVGYRAEYAPCEALNALGNRVGARR